MKETDRLEQERRMLLAEQLTLKEEIEDLERTLSKVRSQARFSGRYANPAWYQRTCDDLVEKTRRLRVINIQVNELPKLIKAARIKEQSEQESCDERFFIRATQEMIPRDMYIRIWNRANEIKRGSNGHTI